MNDGTVAVPGAQIYFRLHGQGPLLLVLQGGAGDADSGGGLVRALAAHYTVLTYDRRGQCRSPLSGAAPPLELGLLADDAAQLVAAISPYPASVFGSSIGALIALDLVARHPDRIRRMVAHEPPSRYLLPQAEPRSDLPLRNSAGESSSDVLRGFAGSIGVVIDSQRAAGELQPRLEANARHFLELEAPAVVRYRLDEPALRSVSDRIVIAGGEAARNQWPYRCAVAVAERIGTVFADVPGNHAGYAQHPDLFAAALVTLLNFKG